MKALLCVEPGRLELVDRPAPPAPGPGEAAVDIRHVGICGTDYHIYEGKHPFLAYPRVMGHELSGVVAETGEGVAIAPGTPVVINPYLACGHCVACRAGKPNCCTSITVLGVHGDGGMTERVVLPAGNLYPADGLSLRDAATVEFLAIGAHAVRRSRAEPGTRALVVGIGPIGLGAAIFARIAGLEVTLLDASAERLAFAHDRLGFSAGFATGPDAEARLMAHTGGEGFETVFDATGNVKAIEAGFTLVAHGGSYVLISVVKDRIAFADPEFHKREATLFASRNATSEDFATVVAALEDGSIDHRKLITHRTTMEDLPGVMAEWVRDRSSLIKAMVRVA